MPDWSVAESAIGRINEAHPDAPLFMTVGFYRPHVPLNVPGKWFDMYQPADYAVPGTLPAFQEKSPNAGNTIVCLLSDHGYHLGEKEISGKNTLWDVGTRVPLILAGPGVAGGMRNASAVELLDVYPTLASLAGVEVKAKLDGKMLPLDATLDPARTAITCQGPYNQTVRTATHRYIRYMDGSEELYDHANDKYEHTNLAQDPAHAETKETLRKLLIAEPKAPLPGATSRLSTLIDGVPHREGDAIRSGDPIPEL